jgi:CAAX protease family protein
VSSLAHIVRRYPIAAFAVLACAFGWIPYLFQAFGIGKDLENLPLGPVLAALVVTSVQGRAALRSWGRRLRRWTASPWLYLVAFSSPVLAHIAVVLANSLLGAPLPTAAQLGDWPQVPVNIVLFVILVGLGEEGGWTAFAAPVLMRRHGLLGAWAVLASMRILWHLPIVLTGNMPVIVDVVGNAGFQLIVLQLMRVSKGAWSLAAIWHATLNAFGGAFFFTMVTGADLDRLNVLFALLYGLLGLATVVAVWSRGNVQALIDPMELEPGADRGASEPRAVRRTVPSH